MASIPEKNKIPNKDNENYSVDEMMARLKKGDHQKRRTNKKEDRELVTREDGSQVVRVRRRKRRSSQQSKRPPKQTNPKLKWTLLGGSVLLFVLLIAGTIFIIAKYNGRQFKEKTETTISQLSGSEQTKLTQLRVTPVSAKANKAALTWNQHSFLKYATFTNIRAKIKATSFFSKDWIGEDVVASTGKVHLQAPSASVETAADTIISPYQFGAYRCHQLALIFGNDRNSPAITDLQVSLRKDAHEQYQIVFNNGTMKVKNWPPLKLSSGIVTLNSQSADIEALLEAGVSHKGELTLKGNISNQRNTPTTLDVTAKNYPIQELLGKDLGRLIQGEVHSNNGSFSYDFSKPESEALSFILPFSATELRLEGLPMFKSLNRLIGDTAYVKPSFYRCQGTLMRTSQGLAINELELINNSLLVLRGNAAVDPKGKLSGALTIGVPQSAFDDNPPKPFTGPSSGFYHVTVTLGGSVRAPSDNLHLLLKSGRKAQKATFKPQQQQAVPSESPLSPPSEKDFQELLR